MMVGRVFLLSVNIILLLIILDQTQGQGPESCTPETEYTNDCNEVCRCNIQGEPVNCTRIRKEFNSMTPEERQKYVDAVYTISTDPEYMDEYDALIHLHREQFNRGIHRKKYFLPWHRWFVLEYENILRKVDCKLTVAYWDWSVVSNDPWTGPIWSDDNGLGGNGVPPPPPEGPCCCVESGPFRREVWSLEPGADSTCLARDFHGQTPGTDVVDNLLKLDDFTEFENGLRNDLHNTVHCLIDGTMCLHDAANAPEFFLHHGMVDKIWDDWQAISDENKYAFFPSVETPMPETGYLPADFIDLKAQPGGIRAEYAPAISASVSGAETGIQVTPFPGLSERANKLFQVSPEEIKKATEIGRKLWSTIAESD